MVRLHIPLEFWQHINAYAKAALPNEVTGIGLLTVASPDSLVVTKLFLPKQQTCSYFCDFEEGELNRIILDVVQENPAQAKSLCFRWHSHADGAVFWSTRDEQDIAAWKGDWTVNLVVNTLGEYLGRLDIFKPFRVSKIPLSVVVDYDIDMRIGEKCAQEVQERLRVIPEVPLKAEGFGDVIARKKGRGELGLFGPK